jgi:hypothetical protein
LPEKRNRPGFDPRRPAAQTKKEKQSGSQFLYSRNWLKRKIIVVAKARFGSAKAAWPQRISLGRIKLSEIIQPPDSLFLCNGEAEPAKKNTMRLKSPR